MALFRARHEIRFDAFGRPRVERVAREGRDDALTAQWIAAVREAVEELLAERAGRRG